MNLWRISKIISKIFFFLVYIISLCLKSKLNSLFIKLQKIQPKNFSMKLKNFYFRPSRRNCVIWHMIMCDKKRRRTTQIFYVFLSFFKQTFLWLLIYESKYVFPVFLYRPNLINEMKQLLGRIWEIHLLHWRVVFWCSAGIANYLFKNFQWT